MNIDFKTINWAFLNQAKLECDVTKLAESIYNANQTVCLLGGVTTSQLAAMASAERNQGMIDQKLCRGHDVTRIIGISLKEKLGSNNTEVVKPDEIEASLRMSYHWSMFKLTNLYTDVRAWEQENGRVFRYDA